MFIQVSAILLGLASYYYYLSRSQMPSLAAIRASNAAFKHSTSHLPVAVFVGGTSGIGQGMAEVFADNTKGNSHIVIVGRNRDAAEHILASFPKSDSSSVARDFVQCDVSLIKNVQDATKDILTRYPKINYLVMSPGIVTLEGRNETTEGIDKKLAVHYYARWKFLSDLLPGLQKAKDDGEQVTVMTVMSAGNGGAINVDDLGLKKGYSLAKAVLAAPTYNDLMVESFAAQEPRIPFLHSCPGWVRTQLMSSSPSWTIRKSSSILMPLLRPFTVNGEECAQYMWHGIYSAAIKPGAWRIGSNGEDIKKKRYFGDEAQRTKLWEHTAQVVKEALASK